VPKSVHPSRTTGPFDPVGDALASPSFVSLRRLFRCSFGCPCRSVGLRAVGYSVKSLSGYGPVTSRAALKIGGVWYVSNTAFTALANDTFAAASFDLTGTWATMTPAASLAYAGTGALPVGTIIAAGVLLTVGADNYCSFDQFSITANPAEVQPMITMQPVGLSVAAGAAASFSVSADGGGLTYQWRKGSTAISGANAATYSIASVTA